MDFRTGDSVAMSLDTDMGNDLLSMAKGNPANTAPADAQADQLAAQAGAAMAGAMAEAAKAASEPVDSKGINPRRFAIETDPARDALLTAFGKETLTDRYLLPGESYQDLFARVADAYADDQDHAQRLYDYISRLWFMPATPVLSNGGTGRGLPISCYLNSVDDSLEGIVNTWNENVWLASRGGAHAATVSSCQHFFCCCPCARCARNPKRQACWH